jgi:ABC-type transporter Mla subunit MlaD
VSSASTEFKVGATILLAGVLLVGGIAWLKESSIHGKMRIWTVAFPTAGGLSSSDEVQVNGIRNGQVRSMRLVGDRVISEIELSKEIPLTRNSVVSIRNVGMMGEKVIAVTLSSGGGMYSQHDTIPGVYEPGLDEAMGQISTTVETISGLATDLRGVTSSLNRNGRLDAAIDDFRKTSEELRSTVAENRALMHETLMNLSATSKTAKALTADREAAAAAHGGRFLLGRDEARPAVRPARLAARGDAVARDAGRFGTGHARTVDEGREAVRRAEHVGRDAADACRGHPEEPEEVLPLQRVLAARLTPRRDGT